MDAIHIGAERTTIGNVSLAIGASQLAREHFRHEPPAPLELENAIAAVEDEIARAGSAIAAGRTLATGDAEVRELALEAGLQPADATLSLQAVEQAFQRLAGRVPGVLGGRRLAATLVILRELMHHMHIEAVVIADRRNP